MLPAAGYAHEKAAGGAGREVFEMQAVSAMELPAEEAGAGKGMGKGGWAR